MRNQLPAPPIETGIKRPAVFPPCCEDLFRMGDVLATRHMLLVLEEEDIDLPPGPWSASLPHRGEEYAFKGNLSGSIEEYLPFLVRDMTALFRLSVLQEPRSVRLEKNGGTQKHIAQFETLQVAEHHRQWAIAVLGPSITWHVLRGTSTTPLLIGLDGEARGLIMPLSAPAAPLMHVFGTRS